MSQCPTKGEAEGPQQWYNTFPKLLGIYFESLPKALHVGVHFDNGNTLVTDRKMLKNIDYKEI